MPTPGLTPEDKLAIFEHIMTTSGSRQPTAVFKTLAERWIKEHREEDPDAEIPFTVQQIKSYLQSSELNDMLVEAQRDHVATAVEFVKRRLMVYMRKMDELTESADTRTKLGALQDLLNRGGTGAAQKIAVQSPATYRASVKDLLDDIEPGAEGTDPE